MFVWRPNRLWGLSWRRLLVGYLLAALLAGAACSGDDEGDEEFTAPPTATPGQGAAAPTATATPAGTGGIGLPTATFALADRDQGLPSIITQADVLFTDLAAGQPAFEVDVEGEYANEPVVSIIPVGEGPSREELLRGNLAWLASQGYGTLELMVVEGFGAVYLRSEVLPSLRHPGFDYDGQYDGGPEEGDLAVEEEAARQRFYSLGDLLPVIVQEAHSQGLRVMANVESLAHIINRAAGSGIGGGEESQLIAGNLPPPTVEQVLGFVDEVLATGVDAVSAEAFTPDYDEAIARHLRAKGTSYVLTGAGLGDVWTGYYYSLYPTDFSTRNAYNFLYSDDSLLGTTNGSIFARARARARARAMDRAPETAVAVGAYNPLPCDTSLALGDVFSRQREDPEAPPIDEAAPNLPDGTPVENCATALWRNLLLVAARRHGVSNILLTADLPASAATVARPGVGQDILARIAAHPAPGESLPIANVVIDLPEFGEEDGYSNDDFFESVSLAVVGLVDDALQAAGYQTVLTYDRPWDGGAVALTYIITAGGNEDTGDGVGMGPPYWRNAQALDAEILALLDAETHPRPVFIHPVFGVPEAGGWGKVRSQFGLPSRFEYMNPALSQDADYHTSLLTSFHVIAEGDVLEGVPQQPVTPPLGQVLGHTVALHPYGDVIGLGQAANVVRPSEVAAARVVASGPLLVPVGDGRLQQEIAPYLVTDGEGRFLWLINQLHHEAFTFIEGQSVARATGDVPVLAAPAEAHV